VTDFGTKEDLIQACLASVHIPFFLNGRVSSIPCCFRSRHSHAMQTAAAREWLTRAGCGRAWAGVFGAPWGHVRGRVAHLRAARQVVALRPRRHTGPAGHIPAPAPAAILESLHHGPGRHRQSRVHTTAFIPARREVRRVARVTARVLPVETGSHVPVPPRTTWHVQPYAHAGPPAVRVPHERRGVRAGSRL
jgi:hypothetical protein